MYARRSHRDGSLPQGIWLDVNGITLSHMASGDPACPVLFDVRCLFASQPGLLLYDSNARAADGGFKIGGRDRVA